MTTMYYDPILDVNHRVSVAMALTTSYYAASQQPDDARLLFDAAALAAGFDRDIATPLRPGRSAGSSLVLAREWGMHELEQRLVAAIEASFEPTWDRSTGEFTWGMGIDEPHPRGQYNAFLAAAEAAGPGRWEALSHAPVPSCPQIVGVDFPEIAITRAEWIDGSLFVGLDPLHPDPNLSTEFRIEGAEPRIWNLTGIEGARMDTRGSSVVVRVPRVAGELQFVPGNY